MLDKVSEFLKKYNLHNKVIVLGFSGGYDSMCLLDILSKIRGQEGFEELKLVAAHFNHNWRGEESNQEQEVCREFAKQRDIEFTAKTASPDLKKSENDARIARYEFFEEVLENYDADAVFTAHNKDDNAETVLYRIIKGTGIIGLRGISEKRDYFYRPLLQTSRKEIVKYCEDNNLSPNQDSSNANTNYKRNYIRLNIIPSLECINHSVKDALTTLAGVAANDNAIIEEYISGLRDKVIQNDTIKPEVYKTLSKPVKLRFLHEFIRSFDLDYDFKKINEVYEFIEKNITKRNGSTMSIALAKWLYVDSSIIETIPKREQKEEVVHPEIVVSSEGEYVYENKKITIKPFVEKDDFVFPESTASFVYVDLSNTGFPLKLRTRQDGDTINPFGMEGSMKLKKYLNSKGINRHTRDDLILLTNDEEVLWVAGVGLSNKIAVAEIPTHVIEVS